mgnify:CR=1 FL=1
MKDAIERNPNKLGGRPVFRGSRVPITLLEACLKNGFTLERFAYTYDLDPALVREVHSQIS